MALSPAADRQPPQHAANSRLRRGAPTGREAEILTVATRLFYEKGYSETSIQDIADELGILKGSLYHYIRSKEDLLVAVIEEFHERARENLERVAGLDAPPLVKIAEFVRGYVLYTANNLPAAGVFYRDFQLLKGQKRRRVVAKRDIYDTFLRGLIDDGIRQGEMCPDTNVKVAALGILGLMNSLYYWYRPEGEHRADDIANEYAALIAQSLACSPSLHRPGHRVPGATPRYEPA
jgi:AcrR family transcriptional regulator